MSRRAIDPGAPRALDPAAAAPRPSAAQALLVYTAGRIVAFLVSLGVLWLLDFRTYALFLGALVLSALLSLVLLRRQRAAVSEAVASRPKRDALTRRPDARRRPGGRPGGDSGETDDADAYDPYAADDDTDDDPDDVSETQPATAGSTDPADHSPHPPH